MRWRLAMVAAAALLLASCWWVGPPLYTGDPADAAPIAPGLYRIAALNTNDANAREDVTVGRVEWRADGTVRWIPSNPRKRKDAVTFVMARLAMPERELWVTQTSMDDQSTTRSYGLIERRGNDFWALPFIDCDETAAIARAADAEISEGSDVTTATNVVDPDDGAPQADPPPTPSAAPDKPVNRWCSFTSRASLDAGIRAFLATNPRFPIRLRFIRIGK